MYEKQMHDYLEGTSTLGKYRIRLVDGDTAKETRAHIDILIVTRMRVESQYEARRVVDMARRFFYDRFGINMKGCNNESDPLIIIHWYPDDEVQAALAYYKLREAGIEEYKEEQAWGI